MWGLLSFSFLWQGVALEGYFSKNIPKEVRGVMAGFLAFCGLIGKSICFKLGGTLFQTGRAYPFIMIGLCNYGYFIFLILMIILGFFGRPGISSKKKGQPKVEIVVDSLIESPDLKIAIRN